MRKSSPLPRARVNQGCQTKRKLGKTIQRAAERIDAQRSIWISDFVNDEEILILGDFQGSKKGRNDLRPFEGFFKLKETDLDRAQSQEEITASE